MTTTSTLAADAPIVVHRDTHQIRKRLLTSLGFQGPSGAPSIAKGTVTSTPRLSCHQEDCSIDDQSCTSNSNKRRVRFAAAASVQEIPHHCDYDEETRRSIWMGTREIDTNAKRNRLEYLADGFDYRKVTEEKSMMRWNGELVHPATYWVLYEEEQERLLREEFLVGIPTVSSSSSFGGGGMPIKKSPTMSSLAGMAA